jgi:formate C-acetyltransferase
VSERALLHRPAPTPTDAADHRRLPAVALYGVDRLIAEKKREKTALDRRASTRTSSATARSCRADPGARELKAMAKSYGFDIAGPARTAREAVQWLYFGYLAA